MKVRTDDNSTVITVDNQIKSIIVFSEEFKTLRIHNYSNMDTKYLNMVEISTAYAPYRFIHNEKDREHIRTLIKMFYNYIRMGEEKITIQLSLSDLTITIN